MSPPPKRIRKLSSFIAGERPQEDNYHPSSLSLSSLPEELVLQCLLHVPRSYDLNLSCASKTLRSLVRSPELQRLRSSLLEKDSVFLSFRDNDAPDTTEQYWFTLRPVHKPKTKTEYRLVPVPFPSHPFTFYASTVAVGTEIFFVGGSSKPSSDLWILDTRSRELTQGPSMKVARTCQTVVGVINGKIYVIGGCGGKIQVEVFDPNTRSWKVGESPEGRFQCGLLKKLSASLDWKVYSAETGRMCAYDARKGSRLEILKMPSDVVWCMCVVADFLYACYFGHGLMWFDAKRKIWRRVIGVGCMKTLNVNFHEAVMTEYDGKLAVLWPERDERKREIRCVLIELDWLGDRICGRIEWSGTVAKTPHDYTFHNCLVCT